MRKPIVETITRKELEARREKIIRVYGTVDELRAKESDGTITPREATALDDLEGFDLFERTFSPSNTGECPCNDKTNARSAGERNES